MAFVTPCSSVNGRLIGINANYALPLSLALSYKKDGTIISISLANIGVVTGVRASQEVAAQFQNALNDVIYITPFGDKPGTIQLSFISNRRCSGFQANNLGVLQHYLDYRLIPGQAATQFTSSEGSYIGTVSIGSGTFRSFLVGMSLDVQSSGAQLIQGTLTFRGWPA